MVNNTLYFYCHSTADAMEMWSDVEPPDLSEFLAVYLEEGGGAVITLPSQENDETDSEYKTKCFLSCLDHYFFLYDNQTNVYKRTGRTHYELTEFCIMYVLTLLTVYTILP